jgi:predicted RNA-binding protein YlxR (DUF448 family)
MPRSSQPMTRKRLPQRTCVGCRQVKTKRQLIRIVRVPSGGIEVDKTGKKAGRGAYLCANRTCWEIALAKKRLEHALRSEISGEERLLLQQYHHSLPTTVA